MEELFDTPGTEVVPVFPLPQAVLFPNTVLPLHVFEARYRTMLRDVSKSNARIAISLLQPGFEEDYEGSPIFHALGTVGRIEDLVHLDDGRFTFNLVGLHRVELNEIPSGRPYRVAVATARNEQVVDEQDPDVVRAKLDLLATYGYVLRELTESSSSGIALNENTPFDDAVNGACANLPVEAEIRQELLEQDDLMARQRRVLEVMNKVLEKLLGMRTRPPLDAGGTGSFTLN